MKLPPPGTMLKISSNANAQEVAHTMRKVVKATRLTPEVMAITKHLMDHCATMPDFLQAVGDYAINIAYFEPDPMTKQIIRTPAATIRERTANCVDYTVLICSICSCAGLHCVIRCVAFKPGENLSHVYPMVNGRAIDVVPGQKQDGTERITRKGKKTVVIGYQLPFYRMFELPINY